MHTKSIRTAVVLALALALAGVAIAQSSQTQDTMKKGAGWGALAGLVFGGRLSDVVEGALIGGTAGAVVGSSRAQEEAARQQSELARARQIQEQERLAYEQEAEHRAVRQAQYESRLETEGQQLVADRAAGNPGSGPDEALLIRAFGQDTVTGWYALRDCRHDTALIAATAGENAEAASHQLAAVWLRAIVAIDRNQENSANSALRNLIGIDPDVSSMQEAEAGAADLLAALQDERRVAGINCGSG